MYLYFLLIRIAALLGHKKARALVCGQAETLKPTAPEERRLDESVRGAIWIHAASVGEFEQARPLIEKIVESGKSKAERPKMVVTFFSPSGYEMRKNYDQVDKVLYMPFATRRNARRFLDALQPRMAIFVKYEFWPAYLHELKKRAIPTYSISAIFRPGQLFFLPWGKHHLALLKCFTHIFVQDESSRELLGKHGVTACSVAGDTRFDRVKRVRVEGMNDERMNERLRPIERFVEGAARVIVAGSTWPKDEELLTKYIERVNELTNERVKLIIVPHEINEEHLHLIFRMLKGRMVRYSHWMSERANMELLGAGRPCDAHVMVVDAMGLLSSLYPFGQVAYIGGGFGVGIHNTIEAAVYGVPVLFGPNYHHFREAQGLIDAGAAHSVKDYAELETALNEALEKHEEMGAKAAAYVAAETGATEKIYAEIFGNV